MQSENPLQEDFPLEDNIFNLPCKKWKDSVFFWGGYTVHRELWESPLTNQYDRMEDNWESGFVTRCVLQAAPAHQRFRGVRSRLVVQSFFFFWFHVPESMMEGYLYWNEHLNFQMFTFRMAPFSYFTVKHRDFIADLRTSSKWPKIFSWWSIWNISFTQMYPAQAS